MNQENPSSEMEQQAPSPASAPEQPVAPVSTNTPPSSSTSLLIVASHLLGFFTSFLGPMVIYLICKNNPKDASIAENAREALNFQLSLIIFYLLFLFCLVFVLFIFPIFFVLQIFIYLAFILFALFDFVCVLIATIKGVNGDPWRYPMTLRLIR